MGNTLQDYRCRIGTFSSNKSGKIKQRNYSIFMKKSRYFKFIPSFLLMFSLLCVFLSSSSLTFNQHSLHSRSQTSPVSAFTIRDNNFFARYINGNIRRNGIKLCHWNKGPGFLSSKLNEIENLINGYHPHILGISEGNFKSNHDIQDI